MALPNSTRVRAPDLPALNGRRTCPARSDSSDRQPLALVNSPLATVMDAGPTSIGEACNPMLSGRRHQLDLRKSIRMATWNVLTLAKDGYREAMARELARLDIDVACLTEARLTNSGKEIVEGHTFLHSGGTQHHHGVCLILSPKVKHSLKAWEPISDRLLAARLSHRHGYLTILVPYAPTDDTSDADKDSFYDLLEGAIRNVPPHDQLVVAGDFNAVTGSDRSGFEEVVGPFGSGSPNDNSARFLTLCALLGLSAVGSWFRRTNVRRWTWISNDGRTLKELDHFLTRRRQDFKSYRVFRGAECPANTDHRLVIAQVSIDLCSATRRPGAKPAIDSERLANDCALQATFAVAVQNRFAALADHSDDVEQSWRRIRDNLVDIGMTVAGPKKRSSKPWLSSEADNIISLKRAAVNRGDNAERNRLKRAFQAKAQEDREWYYNNIASNAEAALQRNDMKPIYRAVKLISGKLNVSQGTFPRKADGLMCKSEEEALLRWTEYYSTALNHPPAQSCRDLGSAATLATDSNRIPVDAPTLDEVRKAIGKLKNGRSPGSDGITAELLKYSVQTTAQLLVRLFTSVWRTGRVPAEWRDGIIVSIYKGKGARAECGSHRPITLLSVPGKVFAHVLLARLEPLLAESRRPQQSGFTSGRSTADAILALRLLSDLHREFSQPLYVAYVDLKSAFDSVDREALWKAVRGIGAPTILLNLIQDLYSQTNSMVRLGKHLSPSFQTRSGVRQGCVLAPALFCRAMDWIMDRAMSNCGVTISGDHISDADYADDIAAIEGGLADITRTLENIEAASSELGLHISWSKTKVQNIGAGQPAADLVINGQTVEGVQSFVYLGSSISSADGSRSEQLRRIGIAAGNMNNLECIWRRPTLLLATKLRLYMTLIVPILLYASETWTSTKADLSHLQAFHMRCQRRILGTRWFHKVTNADIARQTGLPHIGDIIQKRRHALFGHVVRMDPQAPAHVSLKLCRDIAMGRRVPPGWKRPRGRPRTTWSDQLRKDSGKPVSTLWTRAQDRLLWRRDATALSGYAI